MEHTKNLLNAADYMRNITGCSWERFKTAPIFCGAMALLCAKINFVYVLAEEIGLCGYIY